VAVVAGFTVLGIQGVSLAGAQPQTNFGSWSTNELSAHCGDTQGGYVLAIQEAACSHGSYGGSLDNYSGPNTINGVKGLQAYFGLAQDGCAGSVTWGHVRAYFQYVGPPPGYVSDGPNYLIQYGARNQYYSYDGCWASFAYGSTASPVASYRYYELSASLVGLTPQAPLTHGGALPYCGTV
jgi:peptidoglycan hydrolase-like protein with peptidoglycan-binding domain